MGTTSQRILATQKDWDEFRLYADYHVSGSLPRAQAFITVCRRLLLNPRTVSVSGSAGESTTLDLALIRDELTRAERFVANRNIAASQIRYADYSGYRQ